ncbi:MAG: C2HC5-type zinc finger protein [Nitrosopumilus sp.]|nr:C2HC5-type zinc finger protein [Nitrosopumilus sp.]
MLVDIICGNCGKIIKTMKMLRPLKGTMEKFSNRCPFCGKLLSTVDFSLGVENLSH